MFVGVSVGVSVTVGVGVSDSVGVGVGVFVGVSVTVGVGVGVRPALVTLGVGVGVNGHVLPLTLIALTTLGLALLNELSSYHMLIVSFNAICCSSTKYPSEHLLYDKTTIFPVVFV